MKNNKIKFIKQSILFICILSVFIFGLNFIWLESIQKSKNIFRGEEIYINYIKTLGDKKIDLAFFGDSHTQDAVNPDYIKNSFNFGFPSENFVEIYYKLKRIIEEDDILIKSIVLEIDWHIFSDKRAQEHGLFKEIPFYLRFVSLFDMAELKQKSLFNIFIQGYFPFLGNGEKMVRYFLQDRSNLTPIYLGWAEKIGDFSLYKNKKKVALERVNYFFDDGIAKINEQVFDYFLKSIQLAKENGINVVVIKYPLSKEYDDAISNIGIKDIEKDYYSKIFNGIESKLGKDYSLLDYYDVFFDHSEYFSNSDHLNKIGASKLSNMISEALVLLDL